MANDFDCALNLRLCVFAFCHFRLARLTLYKSSSTWRIVRFDWMEKHVTLTPRSTKHARKMKSECYWWCGIKANRRIWIWIEKWPTERSMSSFINHLINKLQIQFEFINWFSDPFVFTQSTFASTTTHTTHVSHPNGMNSEWNVIKKIIIRNQTRVAVQLEHRMEANFHDKLLCYQKHLCIWLIFGRKQWRLIRRFSFVYSAVRSH